MGMISFRNWVRHIEKIESDRKAKIARDRAKAIVDYVNEWAKEREEDRWKKGHKQHIYVPYYIPHLHNSPILLRGAIFNLFCALILLCAGMEDGVEWLFSSVVIFTLVISNWLIDVHHERGNLANSFDIGYAIKSSILWFIAREVIFFFSFFFRYTALSLSPEISTGAAWPPTDISIPLARSIPLLNTIILLGSGVRLTWCHHLFLAGKDFAAIAYSLIITLLLAISFTVLQLFEYWESSFSINDSFFGRVFFISTGFHGAHVIVGSIMLSTCLFTLIKFNNFSNVNYVLFEVSSWYWHFVDVVWLFLFLVIYGNVL